MVPELTNPGGDSWFYTKWICNVVDCTLKNNFIHRKVWNLVKEKLIIYVDSNDELGKWLKQFFALPFLIL